MQIGKFLQKKQPAPDKAAKLAAQLDKVKETRDRLLEEREQMRAVIALASTPRGRAALHLRGTGLEIGALHNPLQVLPGVVVRYADLRSREDNIRHYAGKRDPEKIVETHYVCDGEKLEPVPDESQDFVIANHMLEHCKNPIGTIRHFLRVVRPGGHLYVTLPDKRYTFDWRRPVTTWDHILNDFRQNTEVEPIETYQEWQRDVNPNAIAENKHRNQANIHFHAWTHQAMVEMFTRMQTDLDFPLHLDSTQQAGNEVICLMTKRPFEQKKYTFTLDGEGTEA